MSLGQKLAGLFGKKGGGGKAAPLGEPIAYKGFEIYASPSREGSGWRTGGVIKKEIGEEVKEHQFIRADTHTSQDDAVSFSVTKAKQIIDEQGESIFKTG